MVDSQQATLSVRRQCELLGLNRASFYYQAASESALNLDLMRLIDEQYLRTPFYGWRKMVAYLRRLGYAVNGKRIRRLMRLMGIQAIYTQEKQQLSRQRAQALSLPFAQSADYACQLGLERRHHLCAAAAWLHVPGRCH